MRSHTKQKNFYNPIQVSTTQYYHNSKKKGNSKIFKTNEIGEKIDKEVLKYQVHEYIHQLF